MKVVFFDGYCSLCNGLVDWIIRRDKTQTIQFASLQGETVKTLLPPGYQVNMDTVVYWREGELLERSQAILYLLADLGGIWKVARLGFLIPGFLRDILYKIVAANRYRLFPKRDTCRMPSPEERNRLLP